MAKLTDGRDWLERTLGDKGRAHSLIVKGRDQGIFTKGKRGGSAPDLILADFATLVVCALSSAAPSRIKEDVERLFGLELNFVEINLHDEQGWQKAQMPESLDNETLDLLAVFELDLRVPNPQAATFGWALILLFMSRSPKMDFGLTDRIELVEQGDFTSANILLHEVDVGSMSLDSLLESRANRSIRLTFSNRGRGNPEEIETRRGLYSSALNHIAAMTKFMAKRDG